MTIHNWCSRKTRLKSCPKKSLKKLSSKNSRPKRFSKKSYQTVVQLKLSKNQVAASFKIQHEIANFLFRLYTYTRSTLLSIDCLARSTNALNAYIVRSKQLFLWTVYLKIAKLFLTHIEKPVDNHNRKTVQKAWLSHTYFPNFFQKILNEEFRELTICELKHILNTPWNCNISITWISRSKTCIFIKFVDIKRY